MNKKTVIGVGLAATLVAGGLWIATSKAGVSNDCVNVYVNYGSLNNDAEVTGCVSVKGRALAIDVLKAIDLLTTGTEKYGKQIVCRLNNLPSPTEPIIGLKNHAGYIESCATMPPAFAYWGVFVKKGGDVTNKWDWAPTAIDQLIVERGDSLGLVFQTNEEIKAPK